MDMKGVKGMKDMKNTNQTGSLQPSASSSLHADVNAPA